MTHHTIICRLGPSDTAPVKSSRTDSAVTEIQFIQGNTRLEFGIGSALDQLAKLGLRATETGIDLTLIAAVLTAADTRVSRAKESQDFWTREIELNVPVSDVALWSSVRELLRQFLNFLTGDHWSIVFRPRIGVLKSLSPAPQKLRIASPSCVCLFSGGLDSFIGATDLIADGETPLFVSHYWDGVTSKHQTYCIGALRKEYPKARIDNMRARIGFPTDTVKSSETENTLRGRSFLFFALAALAAESIGGKLLIHVPENGLISLNVPLDPLRLGSLSTRTTHPFYMARFNDLLHALGFSARLENRYRHMTKGEMITSSKNKRFIGNEAKNTMSCSAPDKYRFHKDKTLRKKQHCGHCVPCLIRRGAMKAGLGKDETPYAISNLKARILDTNRAEGEHVRSFQFALKRLTTNPKRAAFDIHRPGPLTDHPRDWKKYEKVYVKGLKEVGAVLDGVRAKPQ